MTEAEFRAWAEGQGWSFKPLERLYGPNLATALLAAQDHPFFRDLESILRRWDDEERGQTGSPLLMKLDAPKLVQKPLASVLNKLYRKNFVLNRNFPEAPNGGWLQPEQVYGQVNDLLRSTLICKYVDGPSKLAAALFEHAKSMGLKARFDAESRDEGYYAYHFYVELPVPIVDESLEQHDIAIQIELQISTQLQEVMRKVTHDFYEESRDNPVAGGGWKWETRTNKFRASYVSHTLHLLESIIVELRDESHAGKLKGPKE